MTCTEKWLNKCCLLINVSFCSYTPMPAQVHAGGGRVLQELWLPQPPHLGLGGELPQPCPLLYPLLSPFCLWSLRVELFLLCSLPVRPPPGQFQLTPPQPQSSDPAPEPVSAWASACALLFLRFLCTGTFLPRQAAGAASWLTSLACTPCLGARLPSQISEFCWPSVKKNLGI